MVVDCSIVDEVRASVDRSAARLKADGYLAHDE
jgi:hypothetical protein